MDRATLVNRADYRFVYDEFPIQSRYNEFRFILPGRFFMQYKHILIATDFSKDCANVITKALELAKLSDAKVSIVNVVEPWPAYYNYPFIGSGEVEVKYVEETKKYLAKLGVKYKIEEKNQHVELGTTKVEINRLVQEIKADLIVLGSHGHHGIDALLGSTANTMVHNAPCDVLVVRLSA
jgi:universal stress protein A